MRGHKSRRNNGSGKRASSFGGAKWLGDAFDSRSHECPRNNRITRCAVHHRKGPRVHRGLFLLHCLPFHKTPADSFEQQAIDVYQPPRGDPVLQGREESGRGRPTAKPTWVAFERKAISCRLLSGRPIRVFIEVFLRDTSHCPFRTNINICSRACERCLLSAICRFSWWRSGMAYGKGQSKDLIKRVVELGTLPCLSCSKSLAAATSA